MPPTKGKHITLGGRGDLNPGSFGNIRREIAFSSLACVGYNIITKGVAAACLWICEKSVLDASLME